MNKSKKGGHTSTYEFLNKDVRIAHKDLVERNKKMTPQELGMDEKLEDVSTELAERDKEFGRVSKIPTEISSGYANLIYNNNNGDW